jgi:hypothetical protein
MAICPHCFADKPAFSSRCPKCTHKVGLMQGIVFDLVYKGPTVFLFFAMLFGIVAFFR